MVKPVYLTCKEVPKFENLNQAVRIGQEIHLAGVIGMNKAMKMCDTLEDQSHQTLKNVKTLLEHFGSDLEHIYSLNVYLDLTLSPD